MKQIKTKYVSFAQYDPKNPIEMVYSLRDDIEHKGENVWYLEDLFEVFERNGYLNEEGKEFWAYFEIMEHGIATNKGSPRIHYDRLLKYLAWCKDHSIKDDRALKHKGEWEKENLKVLK